MEELKEFIFVYYLIFFIIYSIVIVSITKFSNLTKGLLISVYLVVWVFVGADLEPLQQRKYIRYIEKNLSEEQKEIYHYIIKKLPLEERKKFIKKLYFRLEGEEDEKIEDLVSNF